jgi:3-isopropylmalate dehydrogenase
MMLETLGEHAAGAAVEEAVVKSLQSGKIKSLAAGKMGMGTTEVGDFIANNI